MDSSPQTLPAPPAAATLKLRRWREVFAIIGIAAGFFVLLTFPGWFGLDAWRK